MVKKPSTRTSATTRGMSSGDWRSSSRNAGLNGAAVPVLGVVYENETGSTPTTATSTSTSTSGRAAER